MKLDLTLTEYLPASIEDVWKAITDSEVLALWLMHRSRRHTEAFPSVLFW
jgi:uncharacterized protein YndB with AHSA1/START domain